MRQLDSENADAHLGLALVSLSSAHVQQGMADGLRLLVQAHRLQPDNTSVLALLGHYCLLRGDYEKAATVARAAYEAADCQPTRAACLTLLARAAHARGQTAEAGALYARAIEADPAQPLPHYGAAQMFLAQNNARNAATELERVLQAAPACYDALQLLGALHPVLGGKLGATVGHFHEAARKKPEDPGIWEVLGELLAAAEPAESLKAYESALAAHRKRHAEALAAWKEGRRDGSGAGAGADDAPPERPALPVKLLNNAAALMFRAGRVDEAMGLMAEATQALAADGAAAGQLSALHKVTLGFNLARLQEASGALKEAGAGYTALLQQFPEYYDCCLRLAAIAQRTGDAGGVKLWAGRALEQGGAAAADARALLARGHLQAGDYNAAREEIRALEALAPGDGYAATLLGALYLATAPHDLRKAGNPEMARAQLAKARAQFRAALTRDPANVYAINGLGAVLAEEGRLDGARDVLLTCQEAVSASQARARAAAWSRRPHPRCRCSFSQLALLPRRGSVAAAAAPPSRSSLRPRQSPKPRETLPKPSKTLRAAAAPGLHGAARGVGQPGQPVRGPGQPRARGGAVQVRQRALIPRHQRAGARGGGGGGRERGR